MRKTGLKQQTFSSLSLLFLLSFLFDCLLHFQFGNLFFYFANFFISFFKFFLIFVIFVEEETEEEIFKIEKKIAVSEMQETIEEEWKAETREKEEKEGKEDIEEKSENNFINRN